MSKATFYRSGETIWFFGVFSNNFKDSQGDIITEKAHEEYVAWLKETGVKPPVTVFHQPRYRDAVHLANYMGLVYNKYTAQEYTDNLEALYKPYAIAKMEHAFYLNGFVFVIGKVYEHKKDIVERLIQQSKAWGMSHGFIPVTINDNIIEKYRSFEFTIVPSEYSANKITPIGFVRKENEMSELKNLSEEDQIVVNDLLTGKAEDLEEATKKMQELLGDAGLESKAEDMPMEDETPAEEDSEDDEEEKKKTEDKAVFDVSVLQELTATFKAIEGVFDTIKADLKTLNEKVDGLATKVAVVEKTEDERIAEQLVFPNFKGYFEKSLDKEKEKPELVEKLKEAIPTQIVADKAEAMNDPMYGLFYSAFSQK